MSLINEQCKTRPTLSNLNPVELNYYSINIMEVILLLVAICVQNKTDNVNLSVF